MLGRGLLEVEANCPVMIPGVIFLLFPLKTSLSLLLLLVGSCTLSHGHKKDVERVLKAIKEVPCIYKVLIIITVFMWNHLLAST